MTKLDCCDIAVLQTSICDMLQEDRGQLTVVVDDAQSIYGFRGAQPAIFELYKRVYEQAGLTTQPLTLNYRYLGGGGYIHMYPSGCMVWGIWYANLLYLHCCHTTLKSLTALSSCNCICNLLL